MLQIGICDDQKEARLELLWKLQRLLDKGKIQNQIYRFSSGESLLNWITGHPGELDLIFLDIEMPNMSGMEVARKIREMDSGLQLVFVTGYTEYVYEGYSVEALGYLLKPAKEAQLDDILTRALAALYRNLNEVYVCHNKDSFYRIQRKDIFYFASDKRQIQCVTSQGTYTFYGKLVDVEKELNSDQFIRIHQRYLVKATAVKQLDSSQVILQNGHILPISRSYQSSAMAALTRALLE